MIPFTICAAALSYAWPFATTKGAFVAVAVIYGYVVITVLFGKMSHILSAFNRATSGVYVSLLPAPSMAMGDIRSAGMRMGMSTVGLGLGLLGGPPIAGAIIDRTHSYKGAGYYAGQSNPFMSITNNLPTSPIGSIVIAAVILLIITRQLRLEGKLRGKC